MVGRSVKSLLIDCFLPGDEEGTWKGPEATKNTTEEEERGNDAATSVEASSRKATRHKKDESKAQRGGDTETWPG